MATGIGLLLLVLIMLVALWRYRLRDHDIRQFRRVIKPFVVDMRTNLFVPDAVDGQVWVDYLILTQGGILLLDVRRYDGHLFGGENINEWTQLLGMKRSTFSNPLEKMPDAWIFPSQGRTARTPPRCGDDSSIESPSSGGANSAIFAAACRSMAPS